ncbi:S-ribosylhomocysteine lyase LuxS involved in autoinducer biosynthesis/ubiquinone/menaquinone biosynthesis C-methylase UbiE [Ornithinibacillus bavariensis]
MGREFVEIFEDWAEGYDRTVAGENPEYQEVFRNYEEILSLVADNSSGTVLEFGVGTGNLSEKLFEKGLDVIGIEPSEAMRIIAESKLPHMTILDGDFLIYPQITRPINTIVNTYAFHHLTDEEKAKVIKRFSEILSPGGKVVYADTMFASEFEKNRKINEAKDAGFFTLSEDLEREYYPIINNVKNMFTKQNFTFYTKQMNDFVWFVIADYKGKKEEGIILKKMNVESFNLDHTKVKAPYVRLVGVTVGENGDQVYKYDIRFKQPNKEHMEMAGLHSLEHLMAENIRNHMDQVLDISPMGCQTGFYLSILNHDSYEEVLKALEKTLQDVLEADEVPACNEVQCGWAHNHSLKGAQEIAREMLLKKDEWREVF